MYDPNFLAIETAVLLAIIIFSINRIHITVDSSTGDRSNEKFQSKNQKPFQNRAMVASTPSILEIAGSLMSFYKFEVI